MVTRDPAADTVALDDWQELVPDCHLMSVSRVVSPRHCGS